MKVSLYPNMIYLCRDDIAQCEFFFSILKTENNDKL